KEGQNDDIDQDRAFHERPDGRSPLRNEPGGPEIRPDVEQRRHVRSTETCPNIGPSAAVCRCAAASLTQPAGKRSSMPSSTIASPSPWRTRTRSPALTPSFCASNGPTKARGGSASRVLWSDAARRTIGPPEQIGT